MLLSGVRIMPEHGEYSGSEAPDQEGAAESSGVQEEANASPEATPTPEEASQRILNTVEHVEALLRDKTLLQPVREHLVAIIKDLGVDASISDEEKTEGDIRVPADRLSLKGSTDAANAMYAELKKLGLSGTVYVGSGPRGVDFDSYRLRLSDIKP